MYIIQYDVYPSQSSWDTLIVQFLVPSKASGTAYSCFWIARESNSLQILFINIVHSAHCVCLSSAVAGCSCTSAILIVIILASLLKPRSPISGSCLHALCNCYRYKLRLLHNVNATKFLAWKEWLFSRWICSRALHVRPSQLLQGFIIVQLSVCNVHTSSFSVSFFVCPSIKRI